VSSNNLIHKSIRLSSETIDFIEQQPGINFSDKLVGILNDYRYGDAGRTEELARYDRDIRARERRLAELLDSIYDASNILRRLVDVLKHSNVIIENHENQTN